MARVRVRYGFGVQVRVPTGGSHVRSLWGLILTLAYITKRLSREEEEKKRHLVGGQTALLIYSEGRGLHASDPLPFPAPFRRVRLLHQPALALGHRLPSPAAYYRLLPPSPPRAPTTSSHRLHHLARPWALTTGFHRLPPPCAPLGRDMHVLPSVWLPAITLRLFIITLGGGCTSSSKRLEAGTISPKRCGCGCVERRVNTVVGRARRGNDMSYPVGGVSLQGIGRHPVD